MKQQAIPVDMISRFDVTESIDVIKQQLVDEGYTIEATDELIAAIRKQRYNKKVNKAIAVIAVGLMLLFAGFFCTICFHNTTLNYQISLYGFTSLGITLVFIGMIMIFG
ncbi:MAG: hypothetical protein MUC81_04385 [Bacteroidia bacterium]|jgi:hypothetical protein|nr:hypothetical protein [Bacteroidia bacterium]